MRRVRLLLRLVANSLMNDQFEYAKAFEKLFDDVRQSGVLSERDRIISLIEDECCELEDCRCEGRLKWLVREIKGENK